MGAVDGADILGNLTHSGVTKTGRSFLSGPKAKSTGDVEKRKLQRCIVDVPILHSQFGPCGDLLIERLLIQGPEHRGAESTDGGGADQIGVARNGRLRDPSVIRLAIGKRFDSIIV